MSTKRRYIVGATVVFALGQLIFFVPMMWPNGLRTNRDFVGFLLTLILAGAAGLLFSVLTWKAMKTWFER